MAFMAAAPVAARVAAPFVKRAAMFGARSIMAAHRNETGSTAGRREGREDSGFSRWARDNPYEFGAVMTARTVRALSTPSMGERSAERYSSLSRSQFG